MDGLVTKQTTLPTMAVGEVKTFIDNITFNINAIEAERRRAGKYGADQSTLDALEWQEIQLRAIKMKAQMELGKRSAEMNTEHGGDRRSENFNFRNAELETKTKSEQLAELGVKPQRAHEYEKMNKHEDLVNEYLEESLSERKMPSQNEVLKRIKEKESYIQEGEVDTKSKRKGNPQNLVPGGFSQEERKSREQIENACRTLYDKDTISQFDLDSLLRMIEVNGSKSCSVLKQLLEQWKSLFETDEDKKAVIEAINNFYWRNIVALKEEFNL